MKNKDNKIKDLEAVVLQLKETAKYYEKKIRELEKNINSLKDASKDKDKEVIKIVYYYILLLLIGRVFFL